MDSPLDLANLMVRTVDTLCECLGATTNGTPGTCSVYWNIPPDDLECGECGSRGFLIAWPELIFPTQKFPLPYQGQVGPHEVVTQAAVNIAVRLTRPCWPVVTRVANQPAFPKRDDMEEAAVNLAEDAATVFCCLLSNLADLNSTILGGACGRAKMGQLTPDRNRAGCAGFTARFTVSLDSCCVTVPAS